MATEVSGTCIFCRKSAGPDDDWPDEHIIPVALGNHCDQFIIRDNQVCGTCNTERLSSADQAMVDRLGFVPALLGIRGREESVKDLGDQIAVFSEEDGPKVVVDENDRERIGQSGYSQGAGTTELRSCHFEAAESPEKFSFTVSFRFGQGLSRGLHKIAFEWVAQTHGPEFVLDSVFDPLRKHILGAETNGFRRFLILTSHLANPWLHAPLSLQVHEFDQLDWPVVQAQLYVNSFIVSLAPTVEAAQKEICTLGETLESELRNNTGIFPDFNVAVPNGAGRMQAIFRTTDVCPTPRLSRVCAQVRRLLKQRASRAILSPGTKPGDEQPELTDFDMENLGDALEPLLPGRKYDLAEALEQAHLRNNRPVTNGQVVPELRRHWYRGLKTLARDRTDRIVLEALAHNASVPLVSSEAVFEIEPTETCMRTLRHLLVCAHRIHREIEYMVGVPSNLISSEILTEATE